MSLKQARDKRDELRRERASGVDPSAKRWSEKLATADSFEAIAREWFEKFSVRWKESHSGKIIRRLELNVFPWVGSRPIGKLTARELFSCLTRVEAGGKLETAHRALQNCSRVFKYAILTGRADRNPAADLTGALTPSREVHHASITDPQQFGELLRALDAYTGSHAVRTALRLAPLVSCAPGNCGRRNGLSLTSMRANGGSLQHA